MDDVVGAIIRSLTDDSVEGPVNVGSPNPLTNAEYTKVLGKVLNRPTIFPLPAPAARLILGRSEEHTSELQYANISYAVFCLKKKKTPILDLSPDDTIATYDLF